MRRILVLLLSMALLTAVGGLPLARAAHDVNGKVCVVIDYGGLDQPINALVAQGAERAARRLHVDVEIPDAATEEDVVATIDAFVSSGDCDLIIGIGFVAAGLMEPAFTAHPDQRFSVIWYEFDGRYPNVAEVTFKTHQAAFLAGYVSAGTSATAKVGTYGGMQIEPVTDYMNGYALGVEYYNASYGATVEVLGWDVDSQTGLFADSFNDPAIGRALTEQLFGEGADTVFPVAGATSLGSLEAAAEWKQAGERVRVVMPDFDYYLVDGDPDRVLLTSALVNLDVAVEHQIQALVEGTWSPERVIDDLATDGVDLAPFHRLNNQVGGLLRRDLRAIRAGIIDGTIPTLP
jgi:basic membrane protein A and related proteins